MNNPNNTIIYGKLYNFYTVVDSRYLCPTGWHIPSNTEWLNLANYLGGESVAGGKLKEAGLTHWQSPNNGATNSSGFTGLAGGHLINTGVFSSLLVEGTFWSSTSNDISSAWFMNLINYNSTVYRYHDYKQLGFSVRCIKD